MRIARLKHYILAWLLCLAPNLLQAQTTDPQKLVQDTTEQMLSTLKAKQQELKKDNSLIYDMVNEIVVPHFDFISMSKWVLGKNWRVADKDQKLRFAVAFRTLMVRTYAVALLEYTEQEIRFLPLRDDVSKGDVTVKTEVIEKGKAPIAIQYSLHQRGDSWKVYDIAVDGVSLIANYRTSFASDIKQSGLDALIERLEKHNIKVQDGK